MSYKEMSENIQADIKVQLPVEYLEILRSQFVTSSSIYLRLQFATSSWGGRCCLMQYELPRLKSREDKDE